LIIFEYAVEETEGFTDKAGEAAFRIRIARDVFTFAKDADVGARLYYFGFLLR